MPPKTKKARVAPKKAAAPAAAPEVASPEEKPAAAATVTAATDAGPASALVGSIKLRVEKFSKLTEDALSEIKEIGGFKWQLKVSPPLDGSSHSLWLCCLHSTEARMWYARASRKCRLEDASGEMKEVKENSSEKKLFTAPAPSQSLRGVIVMSGDKKNKFAKNDTVTVEVEVTVEKEAGKRFHTRPSIDFSSASSHFDGEIEIEGKKIHVNKQLLSTHSSVLAAHFNGKKEEKMNDVDAEAFTAFLKLLHRTEDCVTDANFECVLQLAERFKVQCLVDQIERFLFLSSSIKISEKLRVAEKHGLTTLMRGALIEMGRDATRQKEVNSSSSFKLFSAKTKKAIKDAVHEAAAKRAAEQSSDEDDDYYGMY